MLRAFHALRWDGAPELEWVTLSGAHGEHGVLNVVMEDSPAPYTAAPRVCPRVPAAQRTLTGFRWWCARLPLSWTAG